MTYLSFIFALPFLFAVPHQAKAPEDALRPVLAVAIADALPAPEEVADTDEVRILPFYSQFADIHSEKWKKVGCGIASLAMVIEYHKPHAVSSVDILLEEGIEKNAYSDAGWTYKGLIEVARSYGVTGASYDLGNLSRAEALARFTKAVDTGPVIASVHYTLDPKNPIPHLIVVYSIEDGVVRYNDPAEPSGESSISEEAFAKAWKQRYIELYPETRVASR